MPLKKKALVLSASENTIATIAEKAKVLGIYQPNLYLGTAAGALVCLFVPIREYNALDQLIGDYTAYYQEDDGVRHFVNKLLGTKPSLRSIVEHHYTPVLHAELVGNQTPVVVGLVNLTTAEIEYFDVSLMDYAQTMLVVLASIQHPCQNPIKIHEHHYADATLFVQNHVLYVMDRDFDEIDVLVPRLRNPTQNVPWQPTTPLSVAERLFALLRDFRPEFQDYSVLTIAEARRIVTRLRYLDDTVD